MAQGDVVRGGQRRRSQPNTTTPVWVGLAVGEVEAVPGLVMGAGLEVQTAEVGRAPAVEGHPAARLGADGDRPRPVGEPSRRSTASRSAGGGRADPVRAVGDHDVGHRVVVERREQRRDRGHPDRRCAGAIGCMPSHVASAATIGAQTRARIATSQPPRWPAVSAPPTRVDAPRRIMSSDADRPHPLAGEPRGGKNNPRCQADLNDCPP